MTNVILLIMNPTPKTDTVSFTVKGQVVIPRWLRKDRSEEHTSELQSQSNLVCRLLLEKKNTPGPELIGLESPWSPDATMPHATTIGLIPRPPDSACLNAVALRLSAASRASALPPVTA